MHYRVMFDYESKHLYSRNRKPMAKRNKGNYWAWLGYPAFMLVMAMFFINVIVSV